MKQLLYIASLCVAGLFASCDDYLTVEAPDQLTSTNFWRDQKDAEAGIASAYSQLHFGDQYSFAEIKWPVEAYREDIIQMGADAMNYPNWVDLSQFTYTNGNSQLSYYWRFHYLGINFANQVLEKVALIPDGKIDPTIREQIVNEAHFLRGYYHMMLLLNWKDIIIRDKYITNTGELNKGLTPRTQAWDFVVEELAQATKLPTRYDVDNVGRATCGAAYAYLGYAYLTRSYEEPEQKDVYLAKAVEAFNQVKGYELVKDFLSMFNGTNKNSPESIFEIQFSLNTANGAFYRTSLHKWIGSAELMGWDEIIPSPKLVNEFMLEGETATTGRYDSRLYATLFMNNDYFNDGTGRVFGYNYNDWFENKERVVFRKYLPPTYEELKLNTCAINVPLMRYANVLLMKAEALNQQGHPEQAIPLINEVRKVHGDMPPMKGTTQEQVRSQIEHERMLEFPLENFRWYDLRRWGTLHVADKNKHSFYPVPLTELNANEALKE